MRLKNYNYYYIRKMVAVTSLMKRVSERIVNYVRD